MLAFTLGEWNSGGICHVRSNAILMGRLSSFCKFRVTRQDLRTHKHFLLPALVHKKILLLPKACQIFLYPCYNVWNIDKTWQPQPAAAHRASSETYSSHNLRCVCWFAWNGQQNRAINHSQVRRSYLTFAYQLSQVELKPSWRTFQSDTFGLALWMTLAGINSQL